MQRYAVSEESMYGFIEGGKLSVKQVAADVLIVSYLAPTVETHMLYTFAINGVS